LIIQSSLFKKNNSIAFGTWSLPPTYRELQVCSATTEEEQRRRQCSHDAQHCLALRRYDGALAPPGEESHALRCCCTLGFGMAEVQAKH